jgi:curli biogenesis system outer membrane secretion channel CsgG
MKKNIVRLTAFAAALSCAAAYGQPKTVFILDFKNQTNLNDVSLGPGIAGMFTTALLETGSFRVVERGAVLQAVIKEQALSLSGAMNDQNQAVRIGQLVGADGVITGTVTEFGIQKTSATIGALIGFAGKKTITARVVIDARLVDISTAQVVASSQGVGESSSEVTAGSVLPVTFEFGTEGFDQTLVGKAVRQAVVAAASALGKRTETNVAEPKTLTAPPLSTPSPSMAPPYQSAQPVAAAALPPGSLEGIGDLYITTDPPGASVVIDGSPVSGATPVMLRGFKAGFHKIDAVKDALCGTTTITLTKNDLLKVNVKMQTGKGTLKIFAQPDGAKVTLDGKPAGEPPLKIGDFSAGEHELVVAKAGFISEKQTVKLDIGETRDIEVTLKPAAYLVLSVSPAATVTINGNPAQKDRDSSIVVPAGETVIHAEAVSYETCDTTVSIAQGDVKSVAIQLVSRFGTLKVTSAPPGAAVLLNGQCVGVTPYTNAKLTPGEELAVEIDLPEYISQQEKVTIVKNETKQIKAILKYLYASLKVTTDTPGASVSINGQKLGFTPFSSTKLMPEDCRLLVELPGYEIITEMFPVSSERSYEKHYKLTHTKAFLDSLAAYKQKAYKKGRWMRRIVFGVLAAGCASTGYLFNMQAEDGLKKLDKIQADYDAAKTDFATYKSSYSKEKDKVNQNCSVRNIFYGIGGAWGAGFAISIPF